MSAPVVLTIGYEGRTAEEVVAELRAARATVLVDVRLTPSSRKPGLSRRGLADRLQQAGIGYVHLPNLGNPRDNRQPFRAGVPSAIDRFRELLLAPEGAEGVEAVAKLAGGETVVLLCFEREWRQCHRRIIAGRLGELYPHLTIRHL